MERTTQNAAGSFEEDKNNVEPMQVAVNTIEQTVFVERLPNPMYLSRGSQQILFYGDDNLYPNKIKSMAQRSQSTMSAIGVLSRFTSGQGFKEKNGQDINKIIVNDEKQTLFDMLDHAANEKSIFKGLAFHFNYNVLGEIIEIQEVPFETLRWKHDFSKIIFCADWYRSGRFRKDEKIEFDLYDPEKAQEQINEVGIDKYNGQILYWHPDKKDIYPLCRFDSCLDDSQFEHETGVYKLKNVQNSYNANYIMFYPAQVKGELEKEGVINDIKKSKGAGNSGKTKAIPLNANAMEALKGRKVIEEIPRTGIDKLFEKQNKETKHNIFACYHMPPILAGVSFDGMFNQESYIDAFDYYNSVTQTERTMIERIFNSFMPFTIWGIDDLEIEPLEFKTERDQENKQVEEKTKEDGEEDNSKTS